MTTKGEWIEYTGSDEQIASMSEGFIFRDKNGEQCSLIKKGCDFVSHEHLRNYLSGCAAKEYLICQPHPLADMICQQARTGQPVWVKYTLEWDRRPDTVETDCTTTPDWNIPGAEYRFTPFEEEV